MNSSQIEILALLANIINYLVFLFISISLIGTPCFSRFHTLITASGLIASISVQLISNTVKKY